MTGSPLPTGIGGKIFLLYMFIAAAIGGTMMPIHGDAAASAKRVVLSPGDMVAKVVANQPEGTIFIFEPGLYRGHKIVPKTRQQFLGKGEVIFNGAMVLNAWEREGDYWVAAGLPNPLRPHGWCRDRKLACKFREDLFYDNRLMHRAESLDKVVSGTWFYQENKAYVVDDPGGVTVELSVLPVAFSGKAEDVKLENLIVEKYASAAQKAAIDGSKGKRWTVSNVTARWNHGVGLFLGDDMRISGGSFSNNGQMGMGGKGNRAIIERVEVAYNNYANFAYAWEAGGFKFVRSKGVVVRDSCIHHNNGVGMWNDIDNIETLLEGNKVFENARVGISHEISYAAVIRNNIVVRNASDRDGWLWGSQILVQNSQDVEVYDNFVEVAPQFGNGIGIIYQRRGEGKYGPYAAANNHIYNNKVVHLGDHGRNGMIADWNQEWFRNESNNRFDRNTYILPNGKRRAWAIDNRFRSWQYFRDRGMEPNGRLLEKRVAPTSLTCGG